MDQKELKEPYKHFFYIKKEIAKRVIFCFMGKIIMVVEKMKLNVQQTGR